MLATENPIEYEGTFPLPEAQLDRFFLKTALGYPDRRRGARRSSTSSATAIRCAGSSRSSTSTTSARLRDAVDDVYVDPLLQRWIVELVRATRELDEVAVGASVRGSLALERAARAWALLDRSRLRRPRGHRAALRAGALAPCRVPPTFLAEARRVGWNEAVEGIERKCFAAAPRPEPEPVEVQPAPEPCRSRVTSTDVTFPLAPRRRFAGLPFGGMNSVRRGSGSDVAGSRPYRPGDDAHSIDWNASARLSSAHGADEFIVREYIAEEAPRVVLLWDRRPAMSLFPRPLPWLAKPEAVRVAADLVSEATLAARGFLGYLDLDDEKATWVAPRSEHELPDAARGGAFRASEDNLAHAFDFLARQHPPLPGGTFIFVFSDFLAPVSDDTWVFTLERGWDVVPVIVQDPVWERSFPEVGGVVVPLHDRSTGRFVSVRLDRP